MIYADGEVVETVINEFEAISKSNTLDFVESEVLLMNINEIGTVTAREIERVGETVHIWVDGRAFKYKAIVNDSSAPYRHKHYDEDTIMRSALGDRDKSHKIVFMKYEPLIERTDRDIFVDYRGERWIVVADSFVKLGDVPVYHWLMIEKIGVEVEGYYDDIEA